MEPFKIVEAIAVPITMSNVDTDQIIPARFLWRKRKDGWGQLLFHDLRFADDGAARAAFVLNQPALKDAQIVVAGRNFGCGSSREHAVWCLIDYGIRTVIAPSFGDIFFNNCFQNGLLPITLPQAQVDHLLALLEARPGAHLTIDLEGQTVRDAEGVLYAFEIDPFRKECLLAGADDIGFTMRLDRSIGEFEKDLETRMPWI